MKRILIAFAFFLGVTSHGYLSPLNGGLPWNTAGDLVYFTTGGAAARLGIGTTGQVLNVSGGVPAWTSAISVTSATLSSLTSGRVPIVWTSGLLTDDDGLTYVAASDALTVTGSVASAILKSTAGTPATAGAIRLGANEDICARNVDNNADICIQGPTSGVNSFTMSSLRLVGAASVTMTGDANNRLAVTGGVAPTGDIVGDGGDQLYGFRQEPKYVVGSVSLTTADCGKSIVNSGGAVVTLPEASASLGCRFTFFCTDDDLDINPADGTDRFLMVNYVGGGTAGSISPSAGDAIRCTDQGASIMIEPHFNDIWTVIGVAQGVWTDVN